MRSLKKFRAEKGMSKNEIAHLLGVSLSFYDKIERGERNPSYSFICKFKSTFPSSDADVIFFGNESHILCNFIILPKDGEINVTKPHESCR